MLLFVYTTKYNLVKYIPYEKLGALKIYLLSYVTIINNTYRVQNMYKL